MFTPGSIPAMLSACIAILLGGSVIYRILRPEFEKVKKSPERKLTSEEKDILLKYYQEFTQVKKQAPLLIPLSILLFVGSIFIYILAQGSTNPIVSTLCSILIIVSIIIFIYWFASYSKSSSISETDDTVLAIQGKVHPAYSPAPNPISGIKIGKFVFEDEDMLNENKKNIDEFAFGDIILIEFSPKSKIIWSIRNLTKNNPIE